MIITCKVCNTSFNLDEKFLKEGGSKVKCSICKDIFLAYPFASARMPDTYEDFSSDAETDKKHSADDESNENLQSYYQEERFNETDAGTEVSDTGIESELQHEDFSTTIESSTADVATASERFEEEEPGIATKPEEKSEELSLDLDLNMEEPDESPGDIELALDSDIEDTLPEKPDKNETDMPKIFAEDVQPEAGIEASLALESEDMPEEMKEPDEPALNLHLDPDETTPDETEEVSDNIEFELEIEPDEEQDGGDSIKEEIADHDEIDLSDIENMLDLESGMDLDEGDDDDIEDIDLELDMDLEEETSLETDTDEDEVDALDLEDLEQMLGGAEESNATDGDEGVEIDLGMDSDVEDIVENEQVIDATLSLDLEEIENMLELDDSLNQDVDAEEEIEEIELKLDNDTDEQQNAKDQKSEEQFEKTIEVDVPDVDAAPDETQSGGGDNISDTIQLEFDLDESDKADLYKQHAPDEEAFTEHDEDEAVMADTKSTSDQDVEAAAVAGTDVARKKRVNKPVLVLLILALLAGATYGAYSLMESRGIKIPYVNDFFKSGINTTVKKVADLPYIRDMFKAEKKDTTGTLKITPIENTITGKYFSNTTAGEIFVIKGKVKNDYDHPRSFIRVKANLFSKGGVLSKTGIVYCGNMLSDMDIENLDLNTIRKRLMNRNGDRKSNVNLKQGATIPFMAVFSDLPDKMNMFNIEVEGSAP
ncbi:MAG: zinc-ribbon domain-containing protein [Deltaproteobacteria bacterium]|nr:zinc-ribbon domain-containing protein [Deltaproteobacteria bacterium]